MARTRAADYDEKRHRILRTASELFAEHGYETASMAMVAEACGMSKPLLYHYYDSKSALLFDIIEVHLQDLIAAVDEADDGGAPPRARLNAVITALLEGYRDADSDHKVQINALSRLPEDQQGHLRAMERQLVERFAAILAAANPGLAPDGILLKPVTMSLFGMLNWHYMWFRPDGPVTREAYADMATTLILEGSRALTEAAADAEPERVPGA
ncbi:TetR/AcrR family transcriptional regulator [Kaustia mangrovi]|uniref:TetR/AcrR family transcriptional regulator n=1 Tax=Kaustia mangrovi TaxID=2593653 RepID=A0A7S8C6B4_9HYPH|nr:TetR/AcrR family transcriptional regulator [Kaustia mangrovi]QPC44200.1 TetR/AcrR family transcriptional regulator [Kaustia mangrovi]